MYVGVHTRVEKFRFDHPTARLTTFVLKDEPLTVRCEIYLDGNESNMPNSSGMADESGGMGGRGNSTLEKVETAAVGRALAFLGYEVKEGIASREEVERAAPPLRAVNPPPADAISEGIERRKLLERVVALCVQLDYDTKKQLQARAKASSKSDDELKTSVIPSLEKLVEAHSKQKTALRSRIYAELNKLYKSAEVIAEYMEKNAEFHGGTVIEEMALDQLQKVADGLEIK